MDTALKRAGSRQTAGPPGNAARWPPVPAGLAFLAVSFCRSQGDEEPRTQGRSVSPQGPPAAEILCQVCSEGKQERGGGS